MNWIFESLYPGGLVLSKERAKVSARVFQAVETGLVAALERGTLAWPLPMPPMMDSDFPPIHPSSPATIVEQGVGILRMDKGMFDHHLNSVVDLIVPHRMNLTDDPFEVHQRWLYRRVGKVSERLLFNIATDWLAQSFDYHAPNTDRWWLAISLINGLSTVPHGQSVHQGYHLVESIALAERPGTWHTQPEVGPQHLEWNPHAVVPRTTAVTANEAGVEAAKWLLQCLENGSSERRLLLLEWTQLLLLRPSLVTPLGLDKVLLRRSLDSDPEVAKRVTLSLAKAIEFDRALGFELTTRIHGREEVFVQRALADVLTRLFRRLEGDAVPFLQDMLKSEDEGVLAAASSTVGDLRFIDTELWADTLLELSTHPLPLVRRNIISSLRDYISEFSDDSRQLFPSLWIDGDEVVRTRMRELLMRMEEISAERFAVLLQLFVTRECDLQPFWATFDLRRPIRSKQWQQWLAGEAEQPLDPEILVHPASTKEAPTELPSVEEALEFFNDDL